MIESAVSVTKNEVKDLRGIDTFVLEIIHQVAKGKKVAIENIFRHLDSKDIVEYLLLTEFKSDRVLPVNDEQYNIKQINNFFSKYKESDLAIYGLDSDNDNGLLCLLAFASNLLGYAVHYIN